MINAMLGMKYNSLAEIHKYKFSLNHILPLPVTRVCNHVIAVYSENKLQHYATAYRNHKSAGEKLCLVSNLYFSSKPG